ncbi:hypothetical protein [Pseudalkalibacillus sp. SCS-8]|uniref:hypothetical protein n=1 Tax=Pseudalkalibacillus nanhaiensis TaxID=3115291 RepID=UPI0032DB8193
MLNIFQVLIIGGAVYVAYLIIMYLRDIKELLTEQNEQNDQIIELLEEKIGAEEKW